MKKITIAIIVMLFILCIPNCSRAVQFSVDRSVGGIYTAMRQDPNRLARS